jgi:hypothetical protein
MHVDGGPLPVNFNWLPFGRWFHLHLTLAVPNSGTTYLMARAGGGASAGATKGRLAEVLLWGTVLTPQEVRPLYVLIELNSDSGGRAAHARFVTPAQSL